MTCFFHLQGQSEVDMEARAYSGKQKENVPPVLLDVVCAEEDDDDDDDNGGLCTTLSVASLIMCVCVVQTSIPEPDSKKAPTTDNNGESRYTSYYVL